MRTTWISDGVVITLDEYGKIGQALFEVELEDGGDADERLIDDVFRSLGIQPMNSEQTVKFISGLNRAKEIQVDLDVIRADELAQKIMAEHAV